MQTGNVGWVEKVLNKPHVIISILALFVLAGIVGYKSMPRNLFPDSNYPEVAVVIVHPGASAKSIASNIAVDNIHKCSQFHQSS